ncbi:MAG: hypothetical protein EBE86_015330 [Hormoscilla sp. GUM202]|nr:hypothetical protein [Hormoscilla sp. GUM202]
MGNGELRNSQLTNDYSRLVAGPLVPRQSRGNEGLHSSLQTFEELIAQIQETRIDIDLVSGELAEELNQVRVDLTRIYSDVTESRLVPFQTFAQRFLPQLNRLTQRLGKSAASRGDLNKLKLPPLKNFTSLG